MPSENIYIYMCIFTEERNVECLLHQNNFSPARLLKFRNFLCWTHLCTVSKTKHLFYKAKANVTFALLCLNMSCVKKIFRSTLIKFIRLLKQPLASITQRGRVFTSILAFINGKKFTFSSQGMCQPLFLIGKVLQLLCKLEI